MGGLRVVVCVKWVPDAAGERRFGPDLTVERGAGGGILSELDEHAVEQALRVLESGVDGEVTYLTMGPEEAAGALRKALSMGGDRAVHVLDDALHGSDALATSLVLAKAIERVGFDLVVCGMASTDGGMSVVPAMLAERLGVPQATFASALRVTASPDGAGGGNVWIRRDVDAETQEIEALLPAVVSVTDQTGEARYPSFKGIVAARRKPVEVWTLDDLGISPGAVGLDAAGTRILEVAARPSRPPGTVVVDEGDGGRRLVDFLVERRLI